MSQWHRKEGTSEKGRLRAGRRIVGLCAALVVSLTLTAAASAEVSFTKAYGWGVVDGLSHFETCTSSCRIGHSGGGAGQLAYPEGIATGGSGDVYVADYAEARIDQFSAAGAFIRAWGWGVSDGMSKFETCTSTCQPGIAGPGFGQDGAGQFDDPTGVATNSSGDVYVVEETGRRIDEFSAVGGFIRAWGWGVSDGANKFETCTSTCRQGIPGVGPGQLEGPTGVATNSSGDVYVADFGNNRIDEFSGSGAFIEAYGWGVLDGSSKFEACTTTCRIGIAGGGAGQFRDPISVATDTSRDVYVSDQANSRIDEFSASGAFLKAYGWGVLDGASKFETCTSTCQAGSAGAGAGQLNTPAGVATDSLGGVYVADSANGRIDEFSRSGAFIEAYGWGVLDNASQFEICTSTCRVGLSTGGAGSFNYPHGVATDCSGDVYVGDSADARIEELGATVPCPPTAVRALSGSTTTATGSLTVTFALGTDYGSTSQTARCTSSNGGVTETGSHSGASAAAITVASVTTGKTYTCTVTATNARGVSLASVASPPVIVGAPAAPTGITVARVAAGQLQVTFTPGANNGSTITGYTASCASTNGGVTGAATRSASPLTVSGLTVGKTYSCIVTATNARGVSPKSNASSAVIA